MRVFITGIAGCIGSALAAVHSRLGDQVYGCDVLANTLHHRVDIRDIDALRKVLTNDFDIVYHAAAMLGVANTERYPLLCEEINISGTENVVRVCEEAGIPRIVFLSSSEIYGEGEPGVAFREDSEPKGTNVYALSKLAGESIVMRSRIPVRRICRMFNCYGPWQVAQFLVPKMIVRGYSGESMKIYANGETLRSFMFSNDAALYLRAVALTDAPDCAVYNIGSSEILSLRDVVKTFKIVSGITIDCSFVEQDYEDREVSRDIRHRIGNFNRLREITDHVALPFQHGLLGTVRLRNTLRTSWDYSYDLFGV